MKNKVLTFIFAIAILTISVSAIYPDTEFLVNNSFENNQVEPSIAMDHNGNFIITWTNYSLDGSGLEENADIFAKIYNSEGNLLIDDFQINSNTDDYQKSSAVTFMDDGNFIVVWESEGQDGDEYGIFGKLFDSIGNVIKEEFMVNQTTENSQTLPSVAVDSSGNFAVTWTSQTTDGLNLETNVYAKLYDKNGDTLKEEFEVNTYKVGNQSNSSVDMTPSGGFVIAWQSYSFGIENGHNGISAKIFDAGGNVVKDEFFINTYNENYHTNPSISINGNGYFVIVYTSLEQDGDKEGIYAKIFDVTGSLFKSEFIVNEYTTDTQDKPSVTIDDNENIIVTWQSFRKDLSGDAICARVFANLGAMISDEFQVNSYHSGDQSNPNIAMNTDGKYVIVYSSENQVNPASDGDIYARLFNIENTPPPDEIPPSFEFVSPKNREYVAGVIEILINVFDENGVAFVDLRVNDDPWRECYLLGNYWIYHMNTTYFHDNEIINLKARALDLSVNENLGFSETITIHVVNTEETEEFIVNTYTSGIQQNPAIAMNGSGDFVVTWQNKSIFETSNNVFAQKFDNEGNYSGFEFKVNLDNTSCELPAIGMDGQGNFLIAWVSNLMTEKIINAQLYDNDSFSVKHEFQVGSGTNPQIAMNTSGNFIITWNVELTETDDDKIPREYSNIYAKMYDAQVRPVSDEFLVSSELDNCFEQSITMDEDFNFVIAYTKASEDNADSDIYAKLYGYGGSSLSEEIIVNTYTSMWQWKPSIAMDGAGNFVITWESFGQDGSGTGIFGQKFDNYGENIGDEFQVNNDHWEHQTDPQIAMKPQGDFVITWKNWVMGGEEKNIYARVFNNDGHAIGDGFNVNSHKLTTSLEPLPVTAMDASGNFVVVWENWDIIGKKFELTHGDTYAPEVVLMSPLEGSEVSRNVTIAIAAADQIPLEKVEVQFNDGDWFTCFIGEQFFEYYWDTTPYPDGSFVKITARATDMSANRNIGYSEPLSVLVLTGEPTVSIFTEGNLETPGDVLDIGVKAINTKTEILDLYIAIEHRGVFYFYPEWRYNPTPIQLLTGTWKETVLSIPYILRPTGNINVYAAISVMNTVNFLELDSFHLEND